MGSATFYMLEPEGGMNSLPLLVQEFCRGYIKQNFCPNCKKKLYGIIPDDGVCDQAEEKDE